MMPIRQWLCCFCLLATAGAFPSTQRFVRRETNWDTISSFTSRTPTTTSTALYADNSNEGETSKATVSFRTAQQQRRPHEARRPKFYWQNIDNFKNEIQKFWRDLGVNNSANDDGKGKKNKGNICIPNETLLNYFGRHDLRAAIATYGGREELAFTNRNFVIMPGKWGEAVDTSPELQHLLKNQTLGLSIESPPLSPQQGKMGTETLSTTDPAKSKKWTHQPDRKPKGFWNQQRVVVEMYKYLDDHQEEFGRPAVWMPRPSELSANGRKDLKLALERFGGTRRITQLAGLVPFREWHFFEGQYELLLLLKAYIDGLNLQTGEGTTINKSYRYQAFPCCTNMRFTGHERLHNLIQYYGGSRFLSSRLGMSTTAQGESWGDFCIEFAIRLCEFIRKDHMRVKPPLRNPVISIPTEARLRQAGPEGAWLHEKIMEFGGYENVARRLYLGYSFSRPMR